MSTAGFATERLARLRDVMASHVDDGSVPGLAWLVARRGEVHTGVAGDLDADRGIPVAPNSIFRISSMTKPITAVAALILLEECRLRLDEPIDSLIPELADRQVLAKPDGSLDDTVPAQRPITVRDLLTFRMGVGWDFGTAAPQPVLEAVAKLELSAGPPAPQMPPASDEWIRRLGTLPLAYQPGERWLYDTSADVLGVLIERAAGQPFDAFLRERVFEPLGMADTGFSVPADKLDRFGPAFMTDPASGGPAQYDPTEGQWSQPPAFGSGGGGLVSTLADYHAFAEMLLSGGTHDGRRLLTRPTIEAMTTNQLTDEQLAASAPDPTGTVGWGFGVGVQLRRTAPARSVGTYSWDGGLGSSWANDPAEGLTGILLTNQAWNSPTPPAVREDFWTGAYAAIDD